MARFVELRVETHLHGPKKGELEKAWFNIDHIRSVHEHIHHHNPERARSIVTLVGGDTFTVQGSLNFVMADIRTENQTDDVINAIKHVAEAIREWTVTR